EFYRLTPNVFLDCGPYAAFPTGSRLMRTYSLRRSLKLSRRSTSCCEPSHNSGDLRSLSHIHHISEAVAAVMKTCSDVCCLVPDSLSGLHPLPTLDVRSDEPEDDRRAPRREGMERINLCTRLSGSVPRQG